MPEFKNKASIRKVGKGGGPVLLKDPVGVGGRRCLGKLAGGEIGQKKGEHLFGAGRILLVAEFLQPRPVDLRNLLRDEKPALRRNAMRDGKGRGNRKGAVSRAGVLH